MKNTLIGRLGVFVAAAGLLAAVAAVSLQAQQRSDTDPMKGATEVKSKYPWDPNIDPWTQIAGMPMGGDGNFASAVRAEILDQAPANYPKIEERLLKVLSDKKCTEAGRDFTLRMLKIVASKASVPAVAELLKDGKTADMARYVLDPIADPAVDEAYRAALPGLPEGPKIGLIGSMALRKDAAAVPALKALAADGAAPEAVKEAAARAAAYIEGK